MRYTVQQEATVWYETTVEADNYDDAVAKAETSDAWEVLLETVEMNDEYYVEDENGEEVEG